ncbi:MAG: type VI secretion system baseplate subunit TssF [Alteromonadaceae bacterium]|nr:MAG: type VI secretion system baseplate subunit TssF [Alteromonadaceae bacterium]
MADELLPYYEKELAFIRQMGSEFSKEHPKIAGRLGISTDTIQDPHVSRLVEGFAYLNARIQHKLDDDFPELSDALLNVVFPHYQRPIPSGAIVQFTPDSQQLSGAHTIDKDTIIETEHFQQNEQCRFKLCYDVQLYPIRMRSAKLMGRPFSTPGSANMRNANGVLKISLESFAPDITFADMNFDTLRCFLRGQAQHVHPLYRMLLNECVGIVMSAPDQSCQPVQVDLATRPIAPVGFEIDEGMLPYPNASFLGYRLLTEYFIFPEKFMFVDFRHLSQWIPQDTESRLDIYIYLKNTDVELEHNINANNFALGCSPAINLFAHRADPIRLDHTRPEYQIVPDSRRPKGFEVYSVNKVVGSDSAGNTQDFLPFYGFKHEHRDSQSHAFWYASRRSAKLGHEERDDGTNVFLSLVDLDFNPNLPDDRFLSLDLTCSNRDQPAKMTYNLEHPKLHCLDSAPPCEKIRFITQPSKAVRPPLRNFARWRLISHLNLNHLSLTGGGNATEALKEILRLYDFTDSSVSKGLVESIIKVEAKQISAPITIDNRTAMCRGVQIEITLNEAQLSGSSSYVYATVLEHFFALYCSVNSFSRVLVAIENREGYLKKCPMRAGERVFL